jgi:hypothetical protein
VHHCELVNGLTTGKCITTSCTPGVDKCGDCFPAGQPGTVYSHSDCPGVVVDVFRCQNTGICP